MRFFVCIIYILFICANVPFIVRDWTSFPDATTNVFVVGLILGLLIAIVV